MPHVKRTDRSREWNQWEAAYTRFGDRIGEATVSADATEKQKAAAKKKMDKAIAELAEWKKTHGETNPHKGGSTRRRHRRQRHRTRAPRR